MKPEENGTAEYSEVWAVPYRRLDAFFRSAAEPGSAGPDTCRVAGCTVRLERLPDRKNGSMTLPQSRVTLTGSGADVDALYRELLLRFLSAGG